MKPMFNLLAVLALATFCRCDLLSIVSDSALRNMLEMTMAEDMADVSGGKCTCGNNACSCCVKFKIHKIGIKFEGDLCAQMSYLKDKLGIELEITFNGKKIIKQEVSVKDPPPICVKIEAAKVCIKFDDLKVQDKKVKGCAKAEVKVLGKKVASVKLGCFAIPFLEQAEMEKVEQTTLPEFGFLGKVKRIIELKQILLETDEDITV